MHLQSHFFLSCSPGPSQFENWEISSLRAAKAYDDGLSKHQSPKSRRPSSYLGTQAGNTCIDGLNWARR